MGSSPLARDAVRFARVWVVVLIVATAALVFASEGEPVCEGPLIYDVDDSDPPQCNTLTEGLTRQVWVLVLGSLLLAAVVRVLIVTVGMAVGRRRSATIPTREDPSGAVAS